MREASCSCGQLTIRVPDEPLAITACNCPACQHRTGSPFGMGGYWQRETAQRSGRSTEYTRQGDTGNKVTCHFCPTCGSTVFWFPELVPDKVGVAVGCFGDPLFPPPRAISYTPYKHAWIEFPEGIPHNEKSSVGKS